jgi:hypothetical protein
VRRELGLSTLLVVNDFTALAMAIPGLSATDLMQVGGGKPAANAVIGVLGPGTGLGVSGAIPTVDGFGPDVGLWRRAPVRAGRRTAAAGRRGDCDFKFGPPAGAAGRGGWGARRLLISHHDS